MVATVLMCTLLAMVQAGSLLDVLKQEAHQPDLSQFAISHAEAMTRRAFKEQAYEAQVLQAHNKDYGYGWLWTDQVTREQKVGIISNSGATASLHTQAEMTESSGTDGQRSVSAENGLFAS